MRCDDAALPRLRVGLNDAYWGFIGIVEKQIETTTIRVI